MSTGISLLCNPFFQVHIEFTELRIIRYRKVLAQYQKSVFSIAMIHDLLWFKRIAMPQKALIRS